MGEKRMLKQFIVNNEHDKVSKIDLQGHSSYEQKVMFRRTKELKADFTEKLKIFLKKELGIKKGTRTNRRL